MMEQNIRVRSQLTFIYAHDSMYTVTLNYLYACVLHGAKFFMEFFQAVFKILGGGSFLPLTRLNYSCKDDFTSQIAMIQRKS